MEKKIEKSLEFIQNIIERMASNSFNLKGWTVSLVTVITVFLTVNNFDSKLLLVLLLPVVFFGLLDSYYLNTERRYRELYKVAISDEAYIPYDMNAFTEGIKKSTPWFKAIFSKSILLFYIPIILVIIIYERILN